MVGGVCTSGGSDYLNECFGAGDRVCEDGGDVLQYNF